MMKPFLRILAASLFAVLGAGHAWAICPVASGVYAPFTTATNMSTEVSNYIEVTGGCIDNTVIGAVTPAQASFTTVTGQTVNATAVNSTVFTAATAKTGVVTLTKTAAYNVLVADSGTHFDNIGATGTVVLTLPTAAAGLQFCGAVYAAFTLEFLAGAGDKIADGVTEGAAAGNIQSASVYDSVCFEAHGAGQWVVTSQTGTWTVN